MTTARAASFTNVAASVCESNFGAVLGIARQLGTSWRTVWRAVKPLLEALDADPARFDGVETLGVDQHVWHHVSLKERGPEELTGMVNLTRDSDGVNGGTEAVNGLIELHRRIARGFRNRDNYRLRRLLIAGAFTDPRLT